MPDKKQQFVKQKGEMRKSTDKSTEMTRDLPVFIPSTDIYEDNDSITLYADLPGVKEKKVDITLEDDVLTITGHQCLCEPEGLELHYRGYSPGIYRRAFTLSAPVDFEKINAKIKDGVLTVILPKAEAAKPRKITVQADDN